ncbi:MAG: DNA/RNA non-specific endonuclease [Betaproteobacteria bacterium]|nr:DNA/RNA non-specific endonuclease [Betaproteobacteria bacterium]
MASPTSRFGILLTVLLTLSHPVKATEADVDDCSKFKEFGLPQNADRILCKRAFLVGYSSKTKTPLWTIERMGRGRIPISRGGESGSFAEDAEIPSGIRSLLADYEGSGYDRGHLVAAGNHVDDPVALAETYLLSNIAPQVGPGFNRGIWRSLEEAVRNYAQCTSDFLIVTGVYFAENNTEMKTIGDGRVGVPLGFYKVLLEPSTRRMIAFLAKNEPYRGLPLASLVTSVDEVERISGQDFFDRLPMSISTPTESLAPTKEWGIVQRNGVCQIQ